MSTAHTPGPWRAHDDNWIGPVRDGLDAINDKGEMEVICEAGDFANWPANARLIAAAPAMLDALRAIADMSVDEGTDYRELLALCRVIATTTLAGINAR